MKPVFQVREPVFYTVAEYWPNKVNDPDKDRKIMVCKVHGKCDKRGLEDGHVIRTSMINSISDDGKTVETLNSTYIINIPNVDMPYTCIDELQQF